MFKRDKPEALCTLGRVINTRKFPYESTIYIYFVIDEKIENLQLNRILATIS